MKFLKNFAIIAALAASVSLFNACEKEKAPLIPAQVVNGTYDSRSEDAKLTLNYSDAPFAGGIVAFDTKDCKTATLTLNNIIPGAASCKIENVQLVETVDAYTFEGSSPVTRATESSMNISYKGTIKAGEMTLDIKVSIASQFVKSFTLAMPRTGKDQNVNWNFAEKNAFLKGETDVPPTFNVKEEDRHMSAIHCDIDLLRPTYDSAKWGSPREYVEFIDSYMTVDWNYPFFVRNASSMLYQVLKSVEFCEDGNLIAEYSKDKAKFDMMAFLGGMTPDQVKKIIAEKNWNESAKNIVFWHEKDGKIVITINIEALISNILEDKGMKDQIASITAMVEQILNGANPGATLNGLLKTIIGFELENDTIDMLLSWVKNGIELNVNVKDGITTIYFDAETLKTICKELPKLGDILGKKDPQMGSMIGTILGSFDKIFELEVVEKFELGIDLQ